MATVREVSIRIVADMSGFTKSMREAASEAAKLGQTASDVGSKGFASLTKAAQDYQKQVNTLAAQEAKSANDTAKAIVDASVKGTKARLSDSEKIKAATAAESKAVVKAAADLEKALAASGGKANAATRKAEEDLSKAKVAMIQKEIAEREKLSKSRIAAAKGDTQKILAIESAHAQQVARLQNQATTAGQRGRRAARGPEAPKAIDRSSFELAENAATVSASLQSFDVASIGAMFGPWGAAAGVVFDQLTMVVGVMNQLGQQALKEQRAFQTLGKELRDTGHALNPGQMELLRVELDAVERSGGKSRQAIYELAASMQELNNVNPQNLADSVQIMQNLERVQPGANMAEVGQSINDVADNLGSFAEAADFTARVSKNLEGDSVTPLTDATKALGAVLPVASGLIRDQGQAAREGAALFTGLVNANVSVEKATKLSTATFKALTDMVAGPAAEALGKKLPAGMTLADIGLEKGNVSVTKFIDSMHAMGPAGDEIIAQMGAGGEAAQILAAGADAGGASLQSLAESYANVSGQAAQSAALAITDSQRAQERSQQALADVQSNVGKIFTGMAEGSGAAAGGLIDTFQSIDFGELMGASAFLPALAPLTAGLGIIQDLITDWQVESKQAFSNADQVVAVADGIKQVADNLSEVAESEGVAAIVDDLADVERQSPTTAAAIRSISENVNLTEADKLAAVNRELAIMSETKAGEAVIALNDALTASDKAMEDLADSGETWLQGMLDYLPDIVGEFGILAELADQTANDPLAVQLADAAAQAQTLRAEFEAAAGNAAERQRIGAEIAAQDRVVLDLQAQQSKMLEGATAQAVKQLEAREEIAKKSGLDFDRAAELEVVMAGVTAQLGSQPDIVAQVQQRLEAGATSADLLATGVQAATDAAEDAVAPATDMATLLAEQGAALQAQGVQLETNNDAEIAGLEAKLAGNEQMLTAMEGQLALYDAAIKAGGIEEEQVRAIARAQEEVNAILADRKAAEASGVVTAKASTATGPTTGSAVAELEGLRETLKGNIATLKTHNSGLRKSIDGLKTETAGRAAGGKASDGAAKAADRLAKANDEAALAGLEGTAKDMKAAQLKRDRELAAVGDDATARAAIMQEHANEMREITRKDDAARAKLREEQAKKEDEFRKKQEAEAEARRKADDDARRENIERFRQEAEARQQAVDTAIEAFQGLRREAAALVAAPPPEQTAAQRAAQTRSRPAGAGAADVLDDAAFDALDIATEHVARQMLTITGAVREGREDIETFATGMIDAAQAVRDLDPTSVEDVTTALAALDKASAGAQGVLAARIESNQTLIATLGRPYAELRREADDAAAAFAAAEVAFREGRDRIQADLDASTQAAQARYRQDSAEIDRLRTDMEADGVRLQSEWEEIRRMEQERGDRMEAATQVQRARAQEQRTLLNQTMENARVTSAAADSAADAAEATDAYATALRRETEAMRGMIGQNIGAALRQALATIGETSDEWQRIQAAVDEYRKAQEATLPVLDAQAQRAKDLADIDARMAATLVRQEDARTRRDEEGVARAEADILKLARARQDLAAMPLVDPDKTKGNLDQVVGQVQKAASTIAGLIGGVTSFLSGMQGAKDAGDQVTATADLTSLVGQTFMELGAGTPLALVGAVMVGGAAIAKAGVELARLFEGPRIDHLALAQQEVDNHTRINDLLTKRVELNDRLLAAGDNALDNAHEQLRVHQAIANARLRELEIAEGIADVSRQQLEDGVRHGQEQMDRFAALKRAAESVAGGDFGSLRGKIGGADLAAAIQAGDTAMIDAFQQAMGLEAGSFADWEQFFGFLDGEILKATDYQERFNQSLDDQAAHLENARAVLEEELALLDLRESLGESAVSLAAERERINRRGLQTELDRIAAGRAAGDATLETLRKANALRADGSVDLTGMTADQVRDLLAALAKLPQSELTQTAMEAAASWLEATAAVDEYTESIEDLFDREKRRLELLKELGRITDDEFQTQMVALLNQRLAALEAERLILLENGSTVAALLDNEIARYEIENDIKNLLADQTGEMSDQDAILTDILRRRQAMLAGLRAETGGGTLNEGQRAKLEAVTAEAIARMRETGASEADIQAFIDSLPKYDKGGTLPSDGPIYGHKDEVLVPARLAPMIPEGLMRAIEARSFYNSPEARVITQSATRSSAAAVSGGAPVTFGDINVTFTGAPPATQTRAREMGAVVADEILRVVQRGVQDGRLDLRR